MEPGQSTSTGIAFRGFGDSGSPLVLCVHGFPDTPSTWTPLSGPLVDAGYRVVAPWLPGYAPSSSGSALDPMSVADRLLALIDELSPDDPVHLVGHDWGAICAYLMLYKQPSRFRAAVTLAIPHLRAIEANAPDHPTQLLRSSYIALFQIPVVSERALRLRNFAMVDKLWQIWSPGFKPDAAHMAEVKACLSESLPAPLAYYRALRSPKVVRAIRALLTDDPMTVPTRYLHGERDGCMAPALGRGQEQYYGSMFDSVHVAEAGHFLHLERPDVVTPAIVDWVRSHTSAD